MDRDIERQEGILDVQIKVDNVPTTVHTFIEKFYNQIIHGNENDVEDILITRILVLDDKNLDLKDEYNGNEFILSLLKKDPYDDITYDSYGYAHNPLSLAVESNKINIVELLIIYGFGIYLDTKVIYIIEDDDEFNIDRIPLDFAIESKYMDMTRTLLKWGADRRKYKRDVSRYSHLYTKEIKDLILYTKYIFNPNYIYYIPNKIINLANMILRLNMTISTSYLPNELLYKLITEIVNSDYDYYWST